MSFRSFIASLRAQNNIPYSAPDPALPLATQHRMAAVLKVIDDHGLQLALDPKDVEKDNEIRSPAMARENDIIAKFTGLSPAQILDTKEFIAEAAAYNANKLGISLDEMRYKDIQDAQKFMRDNGPLNARKFAILDGGVIDGKPVRLPVEIDPLSQSGYSPIEITKRNSLHIMDENYFDGLVRKKIGEIADKKSLGLPLDDNEVPLMSGSASDISTYYNLFNRDFEKDGTGISNEAKTIQMLKDNRALYGEPVNLGSYASLNESKFEEHTSRDVNDNVIHVLAVDKPINFEMPHNVEMVASKGSYIHFTNKGETVKISPEGYMNDEIYGGLPDKNPKPEVKEPFKPLDLDSVETPKPEVKEPFKPLDLDAVEKSTPLKAFDSLSESQEHGGDSAKAFISKAIAASAELKTPISMNPESKTNKSIAERAGMSVGALMDSAKTMVFSGISKVKNNTIETPLSVVSKAMDFAKNITLRPALNILKMAVSGPKEVFGVYRDIAREARRVGSETFANLDRNMTEAGHRLSKEWGIQDGINMKQTLGVDKLERLVVAETSPFSPSNLRKISDDVATRLGISPEAQKKIGETLSSVKDNFRKVADIEVAAFNLSEDKIKGLLEKVPQALERINSQSVLPDKDTLSSALQNGTLPETLKGREENLSQTVGTLENEAKSMEMAPAPSTPKKKKGGLDME